MTEGIPISKLADRLVYHAAGFVWTAIYRGLRSPATAVKATPAPALAEMSDVAPLPHHLIAA